LALGIVDTPDVMAAMNAASVCWPTASRSCRMMKFTDAVSLLRAVSFVTAQSAVTFCGVMVVFVRLKRVTGFAEPSLTEYTVAPTETAPIVAVITGTLTIDPSSWSNTVLLNDPTKAEVKTE
jgi:hypothetical protein